MHSLAFTQSLDSNTQPDFHILRLDDNSWQYYHSTWCRGNVINQTKEPCHNDSGPTSGIEDMTLTERSRVTCI